MTVVGERPSVMMRLTVAALASGATKRVLSDESRTEQDFRRSQAAGPAAVPRSVLRTCTVERSTFDGLPVTTIAPRRPRATPRPFLYLHGGGYVNPVIAHHWRLVGALAVENDCVVTVPHYRLAPEGDATGAVATLTTLYERLAADGVTPVVGGDSAGGGLSLALAHRLAGAGLPAPRHLALFAPWLDVALVNPGIPAVDAVDPTLAVPGLRLMGRLWAGGLALDDPLVSPIHADPAGLPPTTVVVGTRDLFLADCRDFAERATAAGVDVRLLEFPGAFHVFVAGTVLPESRTARRLLRERLAGG